MSTVKDEEDAEDRISLDRNLPVLLGPEDEISIEDIEKLIDDTVSGSYSDPRFNQRLREVNRLVDQYAQEKFGMNSPMDHTSHANAKEQFRSVSEQYKEKLKNDTPLIEQHQFTEKDIPRLREWWLESCKDIMSSVPEELPPFREVNHTIPLVDDQAQY